MFKKLFNWKKKPIRLLGRGGMSFDDGKQKYYIESDNMPPRDSGVGIIIFYKGIKLWNEEALLSDEEKYSIAIIVKDLLEKDGGRIVINSAG